MELLSLKRHTDIRKGKYNVYAGKNKIKKANKPVSIMVGLMHLR